MIFARFVNTVCGEVMKRFAIVFVLTAVVVGTLIYVMPKDFAQFADDFGEGEVCIYCRETLLPSQNIGYARIVTCSAKNAAQTLCACKGVDGISISFKASREIISQLIRYFRLCDVYELCLDDLTVVCGRSSRIVGGVVLDGKWVNLQIAYRDGTVTIGSPLILGSY